MIKTPTNARQRKSKNNALLALLSLLRLAKRREVIGLVCLMVLVSLTEGVGIMMLVPLLNGLMGYAQGAAISKWVSYLPTHSPVEMMLLIVVLLVSLRAYLQYIQQIQVVKLQEEIVDQLRLQSFSGLMQAEWRWISAQRATHHASIMQNNMGRIGFGFNQAISLCATIVSIAAYTVAAALLSWKLACLAAVLGGMILLLIAKHRSYMIALGGDMSKAKHDMQGHIQDGLASIRLTKILGNEQRYIGIFARALDVVRNQQILFLRRTGQSQIMLQMGGATLLCGLLYMGLRVWSVPIVQLLPMVFVFSRMVPMLAAMQQGYYAWLNALPAIHETEQLLSDCAQEAEPVAFNDHVKIPIVKSIELDRISVSYAGREMPALHQIKAHFPAQTTTAIVGASGAGKSTIADILMGLLTPDSGQMIVDGSAITSDLRRQWRRSVAYVQQDAFLFNDSIRNNLLWAQPNADDAEMIKVLNTAAADFVMALPDGLDTIVGDSGMRLSGGERQRIALARALLGSPSLLILDEATSALDKQNEQAVRRAIEALHGNVTMIIIAHRSEILESADQIIRIEGGKIIP